MHELSIKPLYDSTAYVNPRVFAIFSYNILFKHKATLKDDIFVGQSYNFVALATGKDPEGNIVDFSNATAWTVSGKGINSKVNEATLQTKITSKVKATVKASYITISKNVRSGAYSAKKNTATITISPIQMANTLNVLSATLFIKVFIFLILSFRSALINSL